MAKCRQQGRVDLLAWPAIPALTTGVEVSFCIIRASCCLCRSSLDGPGPASAPAAAPVVNTEPLLVLLLAAAATAPARPLPLRLAGTILASLFGSRKLRA